MTRVKEIFKKEKPIIGMVHLLPLPGTPYYDNKYTPSMIEEEALKEAQKLKAAGFDAILFANEGDRPYESPVGPEVVSLYSRVAYKVSREVKLPFGIGVLMDTEATLALGKSLEADFVRMYLSGVFAGTFGFQALDPGKIIRYKKKINAMNLPVFCNVTPHAATSLDTRTIEEIVDSIILILKPEVILIPGPRAGLPPKMEIVSNLKNRFPDQDIIISSGISVENVKEALKVSDGVIVGTSIKKDGILWNHIDPERAKKFMEVALR
ncbi:SgcQ protein [Thermoanaerobacteraceae bacterium SP2]|nr:SgcQ protein [Thermoanaerobacteraceae bacterium SP2]